MSEIINKKLLEIKEHLKKDDLEEAFTTLHSLVSGSKNAFELILQTGRYNFLLKQDRLGLIDYKNLNFERNKIRKNLLSLVKILEDNIVASNPKWYLNRNLIILCIFLVTGVASAFVFLLVQNPKPPISDNYDMNDKFYDYHNEFRDINAQFNEIVLDLNSPKRNLIFEKTEDILAQINVLEDDSLSYVYFIQKYTDISHCFVMLSLLSENEEQYNFAIESITYGEAAITLFNDAIDSEDFSVKEIISEKKIDKIIKVNILIAKAIVYEHGGNVHKNELKILISELTKSFLEKEGYLKYPIFNYLIDQKIVTL